jgi:hypothetical protein
MKNDKALAWLFASLFTTGGGPIGLALSQRDNTAIFRSKLKLCPFLRPGNHIEEIINRFYHSVSLLVADVPDITTLIVYFENRQREIEEALLNCGPKQDRIFEKSIHSILFGDAIFLDEDVVGTTGEPLCEIGGSTLTCGLATLATLNLQQNCFLDPSDFIICDNWIRLLKIAKEREFVLLVGD